MKKSVYITIPLPDISEQKIELLKDKMLFQGMSENHLYKIELPFYELINVEVSIYIKK